MAIQRNFRLKSVLCSFLAVAAFSGSLHAESAPVPVYTDIPHFYDFLPNAFTDWLPAVKRADPRDHWQGYLGVFALSGVLIHYDQDILIGSQQIARRWHLISDTDSGAESRVFLTRRVFGIDADLRVPKGLNASMYYIGDGLTSLSIVLGLTAFGGLTDDKRALNTASQLLESMTLTGMFILPSKYLAGRESPIKATKPGGDWKPAPGVRSYLSNVSKHDAFPSGHIATAMSAVTILHKNYPEKAWLLPVGYSAMGLLMFAMVNNGEHWAGDYPVGIAIGYIAASTVFDRRKPQGYDSAKYESNRPHSAYDILPFSTNHGMGLALDMTM